MSPKSLLISVLVLFCGLANAGVEIGAGYTGFGKHGDGVWYQKDYGPYALNTSSETLSIGWTDSAYGMKWRAGYRYLGKYSTYCSCTSSDRAYEQLQAGNDVGWPASKFYTKGNVHGVYASVLPEWNKFFGEIGVLYYGASNQVNVKDWRPATDETYLKWGDSIDISVSNRRKWAISPVIGVGYRFTPFNSVAVSLTRTNVGGDLTPIIKGLAYSLELRHEF